MLPLWTGCLVVGVAVALAGPPALASGLAVMVLLAAIWLVRRRHPVLALSAGFVAAGAALGIIATRPAKLDDRVAEAVARGRVVEVTGQWVRSLRYEAVDGVPARALLDIDAVSGDPVGARLALSIGQGPVPFRPGDRLRLRTRLALPQGLANPGRPDPDLATRTQGIEVIAFVRRATDIELLEVGSWWSPRRLAAEAHVKMAAAIDRGVAPGRAALLRAVVLGERNAGGPEVEAGFRAAGAVHALSVSGLHLTAVAGLAFLLLWRALLLWPPLALRLRIEALSALVAMALVLFYVLVTGEAVATQRSALMAVLGLGAVALRRFPSLTNAIAVAAMVMLATGPLLLLDVSFQLSFVSVLALALTAAAWSSGPPPARWRARAWRWLVRGVGVSLAAFVVTAPLCAHHFAELSPASPLGNLLIVPLVEVGIVPAGLLGSVLGALWDPLGYLPLGVASGLAGVTLWLAEGFRQTAPLWAVWSPDAFEAVTFTAAALVALTSFARSLLPRLRVRVAWLAVALAVSGAVSLGGRAVARRLDEGVVVTFLDVGQGDATLIEGPRGHVILVDGGGAVDVKSRFDPGERVIEPVLRRKTIDQIDLVVLSHPHPDHMNGLFRVLERFPVRALWTSGDRGNNPAFDRLMALAARRGVAVARPRTGVLGGLSIQALHPFVGDQVGAPQGMGVNDASVVIRVGFSGRTVLFTGDIEEQGEAELMGTAALVPGGLASDLLKVPHHASRTSSGDELLAAVRPTLAVASLAAGNRYGFPHQEVVARYRRLGLPLLRTDLSGAVRWRVEADGTFQATCERGCRYEGHASLHPPHR